MLKSIKSMKSLIARVLVATILLSPITFMTNNSKATAATAVEFYVSATGSDANVGTIDSPFATLEKARDAIRQLKNGSGLPEGGVTVYLRGGEYLRTQSFTLDTQDSGTLNSRITYKAYGNEKPRLIGGASLEGTGFSVVTDASILNRLPTEAKGKVYQFDLTSHGITGYGVMAQLGMGWPKIAPEAQLSVNGEVMTLARYPNTGFMTIGTVSDAGSVPRNGDPQPWRGAVFSYSDTRMSRWTSANDIWMFGYWTWDWAEDRLKVAKLDTANKKITTAQPSYYGVKAGQRFYAYNLLEEIDMPGEWFLDRNTGKLYIYPKSDITQSSVQLSMLESPLVKMEGASNVTMQGITFEASRGKGIVMMNCNNNLVDGCYFTRLGLTAVAVGDEAAGFSNTRLMDSESGGGRNNGVINCEIFNVGADGISIMGGNRTTLTPAGNFAENNKIHSFATIYRTYNPGISLNGVGNRAANNLIYDSPHNAILFRGNDLLIEKNEVYNACFETGDSGAIYTARDWTYRNNILRYNYIHDIKNIGGLGSWGIYLDDLMSNAIIYGNVFAGIENGGILVGGGRDTVVENNIFINSGKAGTSDNRGLNWADYHAKPGGVVYEALLYTPYTSEPWKSRYPELVNILSDSGATPKYQTYKNNVYYKTNGFELASEVTSNALANEKNLSYTTSIGFVDEANKNYELRPDSVIFSDIPEFKAIPFNEIGLRKPGVPTPTPTPTPDPNVVFEDSFEKGFSNWTTVKGYPSVGTKRTHEGIYSYETNQDTDTIQHNMGQNVNKVATLWFYDDAAATTMQTISFVDDGAAYTGIGVNTSQSSNKYVYRLGGTHYTTNIQRATGWHQFTWDYTSGTDVKLYIDKTLVVTTATSTSFNRICIGDLWDGNGSVKVWFDDVKVTNTMPWTVAAPVLTENFENGLANWTTVKGTAATSTAQKHTGSNSYIVNEDMDVISKDLGASYNKVASVWFYDNNVTSNMQMMARADDGVSWIAMGVDTLTSSNKYVTRVGGTKTATGITRTAGWHELKFDFTSGMDVKLYIDNQWVGTAQASSFKQIMLGDWWQGAFAGAGYFDDVEIRDTLN